jgi:hypothetical protein
MHYERLIKRVNDWATSHPILQTFTDGEFEFSDYEKNVKTPSIHFQLSSINYEENARVYSFDIYIMEQYRENENEILSVRQSINDTALIAEDLIAEAKNGFNIFSISECFLRLPISVTPFIEENNMILVGVQFQMQIETPFLADACNAPT